MKHNLNLIICLGFAVMFSACAARQTHDNYYVRNVSCTDLSSPSLHALADEAMNHPDGEFYFLPHFDEIRSIEKTLADQGSPKKMWQLGSLIYEKLNLLYIGNVPKAQRKPLPELAKIELTEGLTYLYMAASIESPFKDKAAETIKGISWNSAFQFPASWSAEAKDNAAAWKAHCGK